MPPPKRLARAEQALECAQINPEHALVLASGALDGADPVADAHAASVAEQAKGQAARSLGDLGAARAHLDAAIDLALVARLEERAAHARSSLLVVLTAAGDLDEALRQADLAALHLTGGAAAYLAGQRALVLQRLGRRDEALAEYRKAIPGLRRAGDRLGEAWTLSNRGVLNAYRGDYRAADSDLRVAEDLQLRLGRDLDAAAVRHNLGFVAARRGDVPAALRLFDSSQAVFRANGLARPEALLDRCETLLSVRLVAEARQVATSAVAELERAGAEADLAEARLLLSEAMLLDDDPAGAAAQAVRAQEQFVAQGRRGWATLARYAKLRATWASTSDGRGDAAGEAEAAALELAGAGWALPAQDARLIAARAAIDAGEPDRATACLQAAAAARFRGPADLRARAWHAEALLRHSRGERRGAEAAIRAGMRILARNRATLGATELRVHASARAVDLGRLGMRIALDSGRARRVLTWAERLRAGYGNGARPLRPPADTAVADLLSELRHVVSQLEGTGVADHDPARLLRRQAALEAEIRRRTRHTSGDVPAADAPPASVAAVAEGLGSRALVELFACDGHLGAVTVVDGRASLHELAGEVEVARAADALRFALGRLARRDGGNAGGAREAAVTLAVGASAHLDQVLFGPVRRRIADRPLVLVPTASLHAVPWASLPSCRRRPIAVSPSATGWLRATEQSEAARAPESRSAGTGARSGPVLVAGPGLAHADPEIADLAEVHRPASTLSGEHATTTAFLRAVNGAELVHVAAHGRFRSDNPLFSSLRLADGPVTVYDLEHLDEAPQRLVLSACEAGLSAAHPGDELMGLVASLLALGSRTLVASVVTVPDTDTRSLMVDFHRRLVAGAPPAEALSQAQAGVGAERADALSVAGFVCFGAG